MNLLRKPLKPILAVYMLLKINMHFASFLAKKTYRRGLVYCFFN